MESIKKVYTAILGVISDLKKDGIPKNKKNEIQRYMFRGIDDVYKELANALCKNNIIILPRVTGKKEIERVTKKGDPILHVFIDVEFDLISTEDGSGVIVKTLGEALDSSDKASNKALSAAYKYMAFQTFCIPVAGEEDADEDSPELGISKEDLSKQTSKSEYPCVAATTPENSAPIQKNITGARLNGMISELEIATTIAQLHQKYLLYKKEIGNDDEGIMHINAATNRRKKELTFNGSAA